VRERVCVCVRVRDWVCVGDTVTDGVLVGETDRVCDAVSLTLDVMDCETD
jgi:hypothetical protein